MTDVRLRFVIEQAGVREANAGLDRLERSADQAGDQVDRLARRSDAASGAMRALGAAVGIAIGALAGREIFQAVDAFQRAENQLRLATRSTDEFTAAQEALFGVSQRTFSTFNSTVELYARLARSTQDLSVSSDRLLGIAETINQAVALSGTSAQAAEAALFQLGQGLAAGALRGEELNSVLEQTPGLARAIASGLGVGIGELRQLGEDGLITAQAVIGALELQAEAVRAEFERLEPTIGQIFTVVQDAFSRSFIEAFNDELAETGSIVLQTRDAMAALGQALGEALAFAIQQVNSLSDIFETLRLQIDGITGRRIAIDVDVSSVDAVRAKLLEVSNALEFAERRAFGGQSLGDPSAADVAEVDRLRSARDELVAILTNQVSPAAELVGVTAASLAAALEKPQSPLDDLARASGEAARAQRDAAREAQRAREAQSRAEREVSGSIAASRIEAAVQAELRRGNQASIQGLQSRLNDIADLFRGQSPEVRKEINEALVRALEEFPDRARDAVRQGAEAAAESRAQRSIEVVIAAQSIAQIADSLAFGVEAIADVLTDPTAGALDIARAVSGGLGGSLSGIGDAIGRIGGDIGAALGPILQSAGAVGQAISAAISIAQSIVRLFGTQSSGGTFDLSGAVSFERRSSSPERNDSRNQIGQAAIDVAQSIAEITGGTFQEGVGIRIFIDANDQLLASLRNLETNALIALPEGVETDSRGNTTDPQVAIRQGVNLLVANALEGGNEALVSFARAAAAADIETEDLIEGVRSLQRVFELTAEPLSQVEQQLANIDAAVAPAVAALEAVGQSIEQISEIAAQAARAVGEAFIRDVQDQILREQNSTLADYRRLLSTIEARQRDALALLERGAITAGEFESVQFLGALQARNFFRNLSAEDLAEIGDFFGLLGDEVGQAAVALARLEIEITNFVDSTTATAERLRREISAIESSLRGTINIRDDILRQFSGLLPQENITALSSELRSILGEVQNPETSGERIADVISRAGDIARTVTDLAAQTFGPTAAFAAIRDTTTGLLNEIIEAGQDRVAERVTELETLQEQVVILQQIRDAVSSPELSLPFIQQQLDEGRITNALLRDLLQQFISAASIQAAAIDPAAVQARADQFLASQTQQSFQIAAQDISATIIRADQSRQSSDAQVISILERVARLQEDGNADQRELLDRLRQAG